MLRARWREISAFSEQEGNPGTFGAKSPEKNPEVRSRGVRAGIGWRTSKTPPTEAERFSSGLANSQDPPGHEKTVTRAGTKRDGDIRRSDPEHNTYGHLNQPLLLRLSGSTVARFAVGGETHVVDVPRGGVVCTAAREMLALGVDPDKQVDVRRDGKPVFTRCLPVAWWAARTVVEDGEHGPRIRLLRPTEQSHGGNSALWVSDCPKDETRLYGPSVREGIA